MSAMCENNRKRSFFVAVWYLLLFQNPLTMYVWSGFSYVDELFALMGIFPLLCFPRRTLRKSTLQIALALVGFVTCGLVANLYFQYQPAGLVMKDLYTNLKFFLAVAAGYELFRYARPEKELVLRHTKCCVALLFVLLVADCCVGLFPNGGLRYGMTVRYLIFGHATYLAAACVFLLAVLMMHYDHRNRWYVAMGLLVLASTLRGKALAAAAVFVGILWRILLQKKRPGVHHFLLAGAAGLCIAWNQVSFYYVELAGESARSVLLLTALRIMKDYFPFGTGFGTYGSDVAREFYSPVYVRYGFLRLYELQRDSDFFSDTFWPIIMGQTGIAGMICYVAALGRLFAKALRVRFTDRNAYGAVLFVLSYLLISSTSEPTFCNSVSIPLAMVLGGTIFACSGGEGI